MLSQHIVQTERETLQFRLLALLVVGRLVLLRERIQVVQAVLLALAYLAYSMLDGLKERIEGLLGERSSGGSSNV